MTDDPAALPYSAGSDTGPSAGEATAPRALPTLSLHASRSALLPALIHNDGPQASRRYLEFFAAQLRNANTRAAYARAATRFFAWCQNAGGVDQLVQIEPIHVAAWIERRAAQVSAPTVKQELAALRKLFDWLVHRPGPPCQPSRIRSWTLTQRQDRHHARADRRPGPHPALQHPRGHRLRPARPRADLPDDLFPSPASAPLSRSTSATSSANSTA